MAEWYVYALLAGLFSGLVPIAEKKVLKGLDVLEFSAFFAFLNLLLTLPVIFYVDVRIPSGTLLLMYAASLIATAAFYNMIQAVKSAPVSLVSPFTNFNPAILAILAYFFLGERLAPHQMGGIAFIVLGAYVMEIEHHITDFLQPFRKMAKSNVVHHVALAGVLYSFSAMIDKVVLASVGVLQYLVTMHFFLFLNFFLLVLHKHYTIKKLELDFEHTFFWVFLSSVFAVTYRLFQSQAISLALVSLVIPLKRLDSLVSTIIGGEMFHEKHLKQKVFSALVMLLGVYLVAT